MRKALAIARVAFLELVRDKVLYSTAFVGAGLLVMARVGAELAVLHHERVLRDVGLAAIDLSCGALGLLAGATAIPRAYERRTVVLALSRPVSRWQLVAGTYLGCAGVVTAHWTLLSSAFLGILAGFAGVAPDGVLLTPLLLGLIQSLVIAAIAVAASSFLTSSLSVVVTFILFLAGANVSQLRSAALRADEGPLRLALRGLAAALPNFEVYSMSFLTTYHLPLGAGHAAAALLYGLVVIAASLGAASILIRFRTL